MTASPTVDREQVRAAIAELLMPGGLPATPAVLSRVAFTQGPIRRQVADNDRVHRLAVLTAHVGRTATHAIEGNDYQLVHALTDVAAIALAWLDQLDTDIEEPPF